jgi:ribonuclease BN (tRNA processing enzyme)
MAVRVRFVGSGDSFGSGGRFQTCILIDGPAARFAIDFGCSSLIALAQQDVHPNSIDAILLTHLHGDHCGGVPFLVMDAMLASKRERPLVVAGPTGMAAHLANLREALFPGSHIMMPRFPLTWRELEVGSTNTVLDLLASDAATRTARARNEPHRPSRRSRRSRHRLHRRHGVDGRRLAHRPRR